MGHVNILSFPGVLQLFSCLGRFTSSKPKALPLLSSLVPGKAESLCELGWQFLDGFDAISEKDAVYFNTSAPNVEPG